MAATAPPPGFEESPITYEQLGELEKEFDDVEADILRHQVRLTQPLYEKRHGIVSQIANFWPLVFEQAPPDIDEYIQPSDASLLLSSLVSLTVRHFELPSDSDKTKQNGSTVTMEGDPRSIAIRFEFAENEHFTDRVLEKKFWHRRTRDGWSGLVSEPVEIHWRSREKDLTDGLLGLVNDVWRLERDFLQSSSSSSFEEKNEKQEEPKVLKEAKDALRARVQSTPLGGVSFFAWFGYRGRPVSEEENALAVEQEQRRRAGEKRESLVEDDIDADKDEDEEEEEEEEEEDWEEEYEIFPTGDDLAVAISEDLWPGALKYFAQAQELDAVSDVDFESDDGAEDEEGEGEEEDDEEEEARPSKKRKA